MSKLKLLQQSPSQNQSIPVNVTQKNQKRSLHNSSTTLGWSSLSPKWGVSSPGCRRVVRPYQGRPGANPIMSLRWRPPITVFAQNAQLHIIVCTIPGWPTGEAMARRISVLFGGAHSAVQVSHHGGRLWGWRQVLFALGMHTKEIIAIVVCLPWQCNDARWV